ncbi:hypothetical protein COLO4_23298 [Corchorus olitorius]|uniref:Bet v I/Major latex protein domain-containing protein n=1 Tax=Corchorus olitorius TaxID=93759 RepID=A0A1R3IHE2_9ROSI|nr:hypothetical protein COLO4_23298 [Corchorus olitorius]
MGVTTYTQEITSAVAPSRLFKALIIDHDNLIPKLMPQSIKSVELVQGDGGVGSIKQINFPEGAHYKYLKERVDHLDIDKCEFKYTTIEGDVLGDILESISYEVKFEATGEEGSVCKMTSHYHAKGDKVIKEEEIKAGKDEALGLFKVVEDYLLANPTVYV